ncbi:hypothetical protein ACFY9N_02405 [Microbacterium sp. NPDC008134]|uniref:hypothetical protein n=1 Tax=Microbacterium sp. NPDC008134 TaxID=3364183 RepID=UPI0036EC8FD2
MTDAVGNLIVSAVPRVYGASELGVLSLTAPGDAHPRVEYVGGEIFIGLDADGAAVTQGQAEDLARPFREVVADAVGSSAAQPSADGGVIVIDDESTASALLLDPTAIDDSALAGAPVVFVFSRSRVVIVGAEDEGAVARALDLAEELFEAGGPLVSAHPIVRVDGAWTPFPWREALPALALRFERVLRLFSVRAYEAQTVVLQRPDVHIAEAKIRVLETGVTTTFAAWPQGTATLLPVVDNVILADPSGSISVATMDQFLDAGGEAIVRTGLSPARYFVPGDAPRS